MTPTRVRLLIHCAIGISIVVGLTAMRAGLSGLFLRGLPTTLMLAVAVLYPTTESPRYRWWIVVALFFSQVGGYSLERVSFVAGVLAFLVAAIAYVVAFAFETRLDKRPVPYLIFESIALIVLLVVWTKVPGATRIPVFFYCLAIAAVPSEAWARFWTTRRFAACFAAFGSPLLLMSDSMIAVDVFLGKAPWHGPFIMITYFVGQWLIITSLLIPSSRKLPGAAIWPAPPRLQ